MALTPSNPTPERKSQRWAAWMTVVILMLVSWSVILSGNLSGRGAADDLNYHWPAIQQFAEQLPSPDLSDYASATTPGYHLILAGFEKIGIGHIGIQLIASLWSAGFVGLLAWVVAGRFGRGAVVLMLPVLASMYVLYPAIWLLPDNAGWLGVLSIILLSLSPRPTWKTWAISGVILFGLIWMRQVHIWIAGVIWLSAWLGNADQTPTPGRFFSLFFSSFLDRSGRACIALACTIPAAGVLVWFVATWGGLVPPTFHDNHQGPNHATPGFILTQLAIVSVFFSPMLWARLKEAWKYQWLWIIVALAAGAVLGVIPESSYSYDAGRYSGWWNLISKFPAVADRSPIFMLGSISGAISLVVWLQMANRRDAWIWIGTIVAFALAQSANHASWQRYHEPMLLIMILLILSRSGEIERHIRGVLVGSLLLAMMLGGVVAASMINADRIETQTQQAGSAEFLSETRADHDLE